MTDADPLRDLLASLDRDDPVASYFAAIGEEPPPEPPPRYSPATVSKAWRGYVQVCRECGGLVADTETHDGFHRNVNAKADSV